MNGTSNGWRTTVERGRILFVHAHPDDETLTTGGTIALYSAAGANVTVLTCTLGEEGDIVDERWLGLSATCADQLGGFRAAELMRALRALGDPSSRFLGGIGRWRDSGMAGTSSAGNPRAFVNADRDIAVKALVAVIRELRPHVVVTYDPGGGYGHPDHIMAHRLTMAAVDAAGIQSMEDAAAPWVVPRVYWTVAEETALISAIRQMKSIPDGWRRPQLDELPCMPDSSVTAVVDVSSVLNAKIAGCRAHATQLTVAPSGTTFALSNGVAQPILDREFYVLARGTAGVTRNGREECLFAGTEIGSITRLSVKGGQT